MLAQNDLMSIMESVLFAVHRPLSVRDFMRLFYAERVNIQEIKKALQALVKRYEEKSYGLILQETPGGWQLRTKEENSDYIRRLAKGRLFQLSAPAMEVLCVVAWRQPCRKAEIDEMRGVESGHLLKTLMEKGLVCFGPKSDFPGRPASYKTTSRFLEVFGLKNLKDLPSTDDMADLMPSADLNAPSSSLSDLSAHKTRQDFEAERALIHKEWKSISEKIQSIKRPVVKEH